MTNRIAQQATALALAVIVTFGVLLGLDGLAASEAASAQATLAQAIAAQKA